MREKRHCVSERHSRIIPDIRRSHGDGEAGPWGVYLEGSLLETLTPSGHFPVLILSIKPLGRRPVRC